MTIEHNPDKLTSMSVCFNRRDDGKIVRDYPIFKYNEYFYSVRKKYGTSEYFYLNIKELAREILGNYGRYDIYIDFGFLDLLDKESVEYYDRFQELIEEGKIQIR